MVKQINSEETAIFCFTNLIRITLYISFVKMKNLMNLRY